MIERYVVEHKTRQRAQFNKYLLLLSDKTFLRGVGKKIRAGSICRSPPFLVTLLLQLNSITMGKSNHFSGQQ